MPQRSVRSIFLREWLALSILLIMLAIWLGSLNGLGRADNLIYDRLLPFRQSLLNLGRDSNGSEDILIVAIDNESLNQIGRWPWSRQIHADLLRQLNQAHPRGIAFDMLFPEPEQSHPEADQNFAQAISEAGPLVLAMSINPQTNSSGAEILTPTPQLLSSVNQAYDKGLGHIHLALDNDNIARSVFLQEGSTEQQWHHISLALLEKAHARNIQHYLTPSTSHLFDVTTNPDTDSTFDHIWQQSKDYLIPFIGPAGSFKQVSYSAVLKGEVPDAFITGKWILIGATAEGLADHFPTPLSSRSSPMPGVEVHANVLAGLLSNHTIVHSQFWQTIVITLLPLLLFLMACWKATPRQLLMLCGILMVSTLLGSFILLLAGYWIPPLAALFLIAASYPLWSWRRLESAIRFLDQELIQLDAEPRMVPDNLHDTLPGKALPPMDRGNADALDKRIRAVRRATHRVRNLRRFVSDSLENLPDITLVCSTAGHVLLANASARHYFEGLQQRHVIGNSLTALLKHLQPRPLPAESPKQVKPSPFSWHALTDYQQLDMLMGGVEGHTDDGREFLIKSAPFFNPNDAQLSSINLPSAWIVSLIDLSRLRQAEQLRDESLRFLSHDMRSPQASILALLELQREAAAGRATGLSDDELFSRVESYARQTLHLADDFVQLARAESGNYQYEEQNLTDLLTDATDELWALAHARQIQIALVLPEDEVMVMADRFLLTRALVNLLSNAIKYSPSNSKITCTVSAIEQGGEHLAQCDISDQGCGIAPDDMPKLFQRFSRIIPASGEPINPSSPASGAGLGLVFVKTVLEKHHGQIGARSLPGLGATFTLTLPLAKC